MNLNSEIDDHITERYHIKKRVGKGAYGIVWRAVDKKTRNEIALKKIFDAFQNRTDAQRTYREIFYLCRFTEHPNVVKLLNIHRANNSRDIYLVFEYMEIDLHKVIRKGNILKDIHNRYIIYQILKAVAYIHSANVIHRDLKPANILLDSRCVCKIADFGLARSVIEQHSSKEEKYDPSLTDYIATRWYRAPEILVASKMYQKGVDMWSIGCILAEMCRGKPLFPGTSTINQIELIMHTVPPSCNTDIEAISTGYGKSLLERLPTGKKFQLSKLLKGISEDAFDFVCKLLVFNPRKRLTSTQALHHPFILPFLDDEENITYNSSMKPRLRDDVQLSVDEYRKKLYDVIIKNKFNIQSISKPNNQLFDRDTIRINEVYKVSNKFYNASKRPFTIPCNDNKKHEDIQLAVKCVKRPLRCQLKCNKQHAPKSSLINGINHPLWKLQPVLNNKVCK